MKRLILTLFFAVFLIGEMLAQAPDAFQYQAVVRDSDGSIRANESLTVSISILQGSSAGTEVYAEDHDVTTTENGLVNLMIGEGTTSDDLSSIDWSNAPYFIEVSVDGSVMGTSQLLSVPYAKFADRSADSFSGSYTDLSDVPVTIDEDTTDDFSGSYNDLSNLPPNIDEDATDDFSGNYHDLLAKPKYVDTDYRDDITTSSSMIPIAMGNIDSDASIEAGTGNFTCQWESSNNRFRISVTDTYFNASNDFVVMVTPYFTNGGVSVEVNSVSGDVLIEFYDNTNAKVQEEFYFIVYAL